MYQELNQEQGWSPIREREELTEEATKELKEENDEIEKDLREGTYQPVPDYDWIQKHIKKKIVRRSLGEGSRGRKEYEFWDLDREPTKQERDQRRIEVSKTMPVNSELKIKYRNDGQVKIVLVKKEFGRIWVACSVICKMSD